MPLLSIISPGAHTSMSFLLMERARPLSVSSPCPLVHRMVMYVGTVAFSGLPAGAIRSVIKFMRLCSSDISYLFLFVVLSLVFFMCLKRRISARLARFCGKISQKTNIRKYETLFMPSHIYICMCDVFVCYMYFLCCALLRRSCIGQLWRFCGLVERVTIFLARQISAKFLLLPRWT